MQDRPATGQRVGSRTRGVATIRLRLARNRQPAIDFDGNPIMLSIAPRLTTTSFNATERKNGFARAFDFAFEQDARFARPAIEHCAQRLGDSIGGQVGEKAQMGRD